MARSGRAVLPQTADPGLTGWSRVPRLVLARLGLALLALVAPVVACGEGRPGDGDAEGGDARSGVDDALEPARRRAVTVETGGCGSADPTTGSGIAVEGRGVLTAAHVVASGGDIEIVTADARRPGELVAYDPLRDLALIEHEASSSAPPSPPAPRLGRLAVGDEGTIVAASTSDDVEATVLDATVIEMDEVRGQRRSSRRGYLVQAATGPGDSGAGLYDRSGRLVGLVFAVSTDDGNRSWVTAASEIEAFLDESSHRGRFRCDADDSRVVRAGGAGS